MIFGGDLTSVSHLSFFPFPAFSPCPRVVGDLFSRSRESDNEYRGSAIRAGSNLTQSLSLPFSFPLVLPLLSNRDCNDDTFTDARFSFLFRIIRIVAQDILHARRRLTSL